MATVTVFSTTADGFVNKVSQPTWTAARDATTGGAVNTSSSTSTAAVSSYEVGGNNYNVSRSFFYFDLSGESGSADSASVFIHGDSNANTDVSAQLGTQATTMTTADYDSFSGSEYGHVTWNASAYNEIVFNAQGISDVDSQIGSGTMKVCARDYTYDYLNVSVTGLLFNGLVWADNATNKPYLEIETSGGGGAVDALFFSHNM